MLFRSRPCNLTEMLSMMGGQNTYSFIRQGVKYVLNPSKDIPTRVLLHSQVSLMSCRDFEPVCKGEKTADALVTLGKSQGGAKEVPREVSRLLDRIFRLVCHLFVIFSLQLTSFQVLSFLLIWLEF